MTHIFITITLILTLFHVVSGMPHLQRRGLPGAVYICDEPNFRGNCQWSEPTTRCAQQGPDGKGVESLGPDPGGFCTLYEKFDCTGNQIQTLRFPGAQSNLPTFGSFRCFRDATRVRTVGQGSKAGGAPGSKGTFDGFADPRLAGGVGSMDRRVHLQEIQDMEADNFSQGLIGLNKNVYY